jgi:small subunit ribosomal protein S4
MVKTGDVISVRDKSKKQNRVVEALQLAQQVGMPAWVEVSLDKAEGTFKKAPDRDQFAADINESLIVELYSLISRLSVKSFLNCGHCGSGASPALPM